MRCAPSGLSRRNRSWMEVRSSCSLASKSNVVPDAQLLKILQKYAGEFNWLATRTRPDLAYFTSLIASSMKAHGEWAHTLYKKVLRYLLGTVDQGLVMKYIPQASVAPA